METKSWVRREVVAALEARHPWLHRSHHPFPCTPSSLTVSLSEPPLPLALLRQLSHAPVRVRNVLLQKLTEGIQTAGPQLTRPLQEPVLGPAWHDCTTGYADVGSPAHGPLAAPGVALPRFGVREHGAEVRVGRVAAVADAGWPRGARGGLGVGGSRRAQVVDGLPGLVGKRGACVGGEMGGGGGGEWVWEL